MHKSPFISVSRKVSLEGMAMRSRSLDGASLGGGVILDAPPQPPQHDYVAEMLSHNTCLADLLDYSEGGSTNKVVIKTTTSHGVSPSPSPTSFDTPSASSSSSTSSTPPSPTTTTTNRSCHRSLKKQRDNHSNNHHNKPNHLDNGLTFKGHPRQYARHDYHDHANDDTPSSICSVEQVTEMMNVRGGVKTPFPLRLHTMLDAVEAEGMTNVVSWQPHGRAFCVHDTHRFVHDIMPRFFQQHKYSSFQRQLNLYGFMRLTRKGPDHGGYYHELFLRGKVFLCASIQRIRVKGTLIRTTSSPETEPDFYLMPSVECSTAAATTTTTSPTTSPTMITANNSIDDSVAFTPTPPTLAAAAATGPSQALLPVAGVTATAVVAPPEFQQQQQHPTVSYSNRFSESTDSAVVDEWTLQQQRLRFDQVVANTAAGMSFQSTAAAPVVQPMPAAPTPQQCQQQHHEQQLYHHQQHQQFAPTDMNSNYNTSIKPSSSLLSLTDLQALWDLPWSIPADSYRGGGSCGWESCSSGTGTTTMASAAANGNTTPLVDETELAFFLDDVDFYSSDMELLAEI